LLFLLVAIRMAGMVSERKILEQRLEFQAFHDPLTDLPNRALFEDHLEQALARKPRHGDNVAVLFVDLDDFKEINDSFGHQTGDKVLVVVAHRLRACLRPADTPARLGGDEFTVLLEDVEDGGELYRSQSVSWRKCEHLSHSGNSIPWLAPASGSPWVVPTTTRESS
jgi:diguanylate cyclase (GGDEF)-like protein